MARRLLLMCVATALGSCTCQDTLDFDAGYACTSNDDCAEGFECFRGRCSDGSATGGGRGGGTGLGGGAQASGGGFSGTGGGESFAGGGTSTGGGTSSGGGSVSTGGGAATGGGSSSGGGSASTGGGAGSTGGGAAAGGGAGSTGGGMSAGGGTGSTGGGAGAMGGGSGSTGGGAATGGGGNPPPVLHLAFVTPSMSSPVGGCSSDITVEVLDASNNPYVELSALTVNIASSPSSGMILHTNACGGSVSSFVIGAGASSSHFRYTGSIPGSYTLTVSGMGVMSAMQAEVVTALTPTKLAFTNPTYVAVGAGTCQTVTVQLQDAMGTPVLTGSPFTVTLDTSPAAITPATFYTDSSCTNAVTTANIPTAASSVTLYVSAWTGRTYTLTASGGSLTAAMQSFDVRPLVRHGTCTLDSSTASRACSFSPPQQTFGNTLFLFQAASSSSNLAAVSVRCELTGSASILCKRIVTGTQVRVEWQTLELDTGMSVNKGTAFCPNDGGTSAAVSFTGGSAGTLLITSAQTDSTALDGTTLYTLDRNGSNVAANWKHPCTSGSATNYQIAVQAVTLPGVAGQVLAGQLDSGVARLFVPLASPTDSFTLITHLSDATAAGANTLCELMARAEAVDSGVAYTRGVSSGSTPGACTNSAISAISGQRFFAGSLTHIQQFVTTLAAGTSSLTIPISSVDATRSLTFASSQAGGAGQGIGESAFTGGVILGDVSATHVLDGGATFDARELYLTRDSTQDDAKWTSYVVQFGP